MRAQGVLPHEGICFVAILRGINAANSQTTYLVSAFPAAWGQAGHELAAGQKMLLEEKLTYVRSPPQSEGQLRLRGGPSRALAFAWLSWSLAPFVKRISDTFSLAYPGLRTLAMEVHREFQISRVGALQSRGKQDEAMLEASSQA